MNNDYFKFLLLNIKAAAVTLYLVLLPLLIYDLIFTYRDIFSIVINIFLIKWLYKEKDSIMKIAKNIYDGDGPELD